MIQGYRKIMIEKFKNWWNRKAIAEAKEDVKKETKRLKNEVKRREGAMGIFTNSEHLLFESVWETVNNRNYYGGSKHLHDNTYIMYKIWEKFNDERMEAKHYPNRRTIRGECDGIIFHGGCLGCASQELLGVDRCKGCTYFKSGRDLPNLEIKGGDVSRCTISSQEDWDGTGTFTINEI